jgi:hypothetical protein
MLEICKTMLFPYWIVQFFIIGVSVKWLNNYDFTMYSRADLFEAGFLHVI